LKKPKNKQQKAEKTKYMLYSTSIKFSMVFKKL